MRFTHICYKLFTRNVSSKCNGNMDIENNVVNKSLNMLFEYVCSDLFLYPRIIPLTDLTSKPESIIRDKGIDIHFT